MYYFISNTDEAFTLQAFRKLYEAVDLGWVYAITKYEPVSLDLISLTNVLPQSEASSFNGPLTDWIAENV